MNKTAEANDDIRIEIGEDLPEREVVEKPETPPARPVAGGVEEEDLSQYGDKVQKRIGKLTWERNEERRKSEEAARLREEAVRYAETVARDNAELRQKLSQGQSSALTASMAAVTAELSNAKAAYKQAYEAGDADRVTEAQVLISELITRKSQLETATSAQAARPQAKDVAPPAAAPRPQVATPDPNAQAWAQKNAWFGADEVMTGFAFGMHEQLVRSGVDPRSETYYSRIDEAVRTKFPEKFETPGQDVIVQPRTPGTVVAPASRDVKAPRTVRLTPSAAQLAKRLGLSPEQYAAQVLKDRQNG